LLNLYAFFSYFLAVLFPWVEKHGAYKLINNNTYIAGVMKFVLCTYRFGVVRRQEKSSLILNYFIWKHCGTVPYFFWNCTVIFIAKIIWVDYFANNYLLTYDSYVPLYNRFHRGEWITRACPGVSRAPSPPLTQVIHSPLWNLLYTGT
jgi:hypothetical protein